MCRIETFVDKGLPFPLVVLEWALSVVSKSLAEEALSFEGQSLPVLDKLASRVSMIPCLF